MKDRRGFTLLEIMIVIAIVGIMAVVATTNFFSWQQHYSAVDFQREFLSQCNLARTRALSFTRQYRLYIDINNDNVSLQEGNAGTDSSTWMPSGMTLKADKPNSAGINDIVCTPTFTASSSIIALVFNPNGEVLVQDPTTTIRPTPLTQVDVHLSAKSVADRSTIRVYGWTSKARLLNGWP
jgi:prepilin-type N-terminal cleavage/methylation domain-containing protein